MFRDTSKCGTKYVKIKTKFNGSQIEIQNIYIRWLISRIPKESTKTITMIPSIQSTFLSALLLAIQLAAAEAAVPIKTKYTAAGFDAYIYAGYKSCSSHFTSSISASVYGSTSQFKDAGSDDFKVVSDTYESMYVSLDLVESCDEDTVEFLTGSVWESSYSGTTAPKFTIEYKKLSEASFIDIPVPVYRYYCTFECNEICYAEIWGIGTCEEEEAHVDCYPTSCTEHEEAGTATVNVQWTDNSNTALFTSSNTYRYKDPQTGSYSSSRSKGSSRYIENATITAVLIEHEKATFLSKEPTFVDAQLSSTTEKTISKYGMSY